MSDNPNYAPLGLSTVTDVFKTIPQLQEDDHSQAHRNFYESTRSVIERSTTISRGDNFTDVSPETIISGVPHVFVCNGNNGKEFRGVGDLRIWNSTTNKIENLVSGGTYFVIIGFNLKGPDNGQEVLGDIIDDSDGFTVIGVATPIDIMFTSPLAYLPYQMIFNFRAPAESEGKTFTLSLLTSANNTNLGLRNITVHRDR